MRLVIAAELGEQPRDPLGIGFGEAQCLLSGAAFVAADDAGEIGAGMQVTALYELALGDAPIPQPARAPAPRAFATMSGERDATAGDLALVKLRYKRHGDGESEPVLQTDARLGAAELIDAESSSDSDFAWAAAIAAFAELLKQSPFADPRALPLLDSVFHAQADRDAERREFVQLFDRWKQLR